MRKRLLMIVGFALLLFSGLLAGCAAHSVSASASGSALASPLSQAECQKTVTDYTGSADVKFVEKVPDNADTDKGEYKFSCGAYIYYTDPGKRYICRIDPAFNDAWAKLEAQGTGAPVESRIKEQAVSVFKKTLAPFLFPQSSVEIESMMGSGDADYTLTMIEKSNGVPTGNSAGLSYAKSGVFWGGVFMKADTKNSDKKGAAVRILQDQAADIALKKAKTEASLVEAKDIRFEKAELTALKGRTVWRVYLGYTSTKYIAEGETLSALVFVDAETGEVGTFYLCS